MDEKVEDVFRQLRNQLNKPQGTFTFSVQPKVLRLTEGDSIRVFVVSSEDGETDVNVTKNEDDELVFEYESQQFGDKECRVSLSGLEHSTEVLGEITWQKDKIQLSVVSKVSGVVKEQRSSSSDPEEFRRGFGDVASRG